MRYLCPECDKLMIHSSDYDDDNNTWSLFLCNDCGIELTKSWEIESSI